MYRMIRRLSADFNDLHEPLAVSCGTLNRGSEALRFEMPRAGARNEDAIALEHLHGEVVESLVGGFTLRNILLALDERRWIDDDHVESLLLRTESFEHVERIAAQGARLQSVGATRALDRVERRG